MIDGLGPQRITALLERFGSVARVRQAGVSELMQVSGIGEQISAAIRGSLPGVDVSAEVEQMDRAGVRLLRRGQADYPAALPAALTAFRPRVPCDPVPERMMQMDRSC